MTTARAHLVDPHADGFYHCISRCVRRGWLCGKDPVSGQSYEHRKVWVESRILMLSEVFAVRLCSYAVMSNHFHVVLETRPSIAKSMPDKEVAERWLRLCSKKRQANAVNEVDNMLASPERIAKLRERLGSLSWFMKSLNEPIARAANQEDDCKGRFWEGRFTSISLLDEAAVIGCMTYVDLNPVRAGIAKEPKRAPFTSIRRRVSLGDSNEPVSPLTTLETVGLTLQSYLELLDWTVGHGKGQRSQPGTRARKLLRTLNHDPIGWIKSVQSHRSKYRAYGSVDKLRCYAKSLGQNWVKGVGALS